MVTVIAQVRDTERKLETWAHGRRVIATLAVSRALICVRSPGFNVGDVTVPAYESKLEDA